MVGGMQIQFNPSLMRAPLTRGPGPARPEAALEQPTEMLILSGATAQSSADSSVASAPVAPVQTVTAPPDPNRPFAGCVGRLIRGKNEGDFESLTNDATRKLVFLMDSQGLEELEGKSGYQQLIQIGHTPEHIMEEVQSKGNRYKLVVWPRGGPDMSATWDNVSNLVGQLYPDVAEKVAARISELKAPEFSTWEDKAGYSFADVKPGDARYVGYEELKQREGSALEVREFLYHVCHLRELYTGDGFTKKADGSRGVPEYISPNLKIADMPGARVIDVKIDLPACLPMF